MLGIFLDTETTGLNPKKHTTIEISYRIIDLITSHEKGSFNSIVKIDKETFSKADPSSLNVNGFTFEEIEKGLEAEEIKKTIVSTFTSLDIVRSKAVFICQNPSFDRAFFAKMIDTDEQEKRKWPYHWLDLASMYWAICLKNDKTYPWKTGVSKDNIAVSLGLSKEPYPHRAQNGVDHLVACYEKLIGFPGVKN